MYIYIVYSFCTTLPIAWQSICDLRSCKAMTLVRFISLSCHFIFFYIFFFCFLFFFLSDIICFSWKWETGGRFRSSIYDGKNWNTGYNFLQCHFFIFSSWLSVSVPSSPAVPPFWEYWKYIRYWKWREKKEHPLHGHATSCGQQMNRRLGSSSGWAKSRWQTMRMKRWNGSPLHVPERERERVGIDFSMMAHNWSTSWMPVVSPALGEEIRRQKRMKIGNKVEEGKKKYTVF